MSAFISTSVRGVLRAAPLALVAAFSLAAFASGCDDMNKPAKVPPSEVRHGCFSDVECPGGKCVKEGGADIQGTCTMAPADAGSAAPGEHHI